MKVSVVTVCYNSEKTIKYTIESVLEQSYSNLEYIIIDGASTDRTVEIIDKYKGSIALVISEPDMGIYDAMNKGLKLATGDVIGILNSDDLYVNKEVISLVAEAFFVSDAGMVFGSLVYVDRHNVNNVKRHYSSRKFCPWKLRMGWMPPHPATFIRKSVYKKAGLYSLSYKIAADYEMFVRLLLVHNVSFYVIPCVLVRMRMGGISTRNINSSWLLNKEIVRACLSNNIYTNIVFVLSKIPLKLLELLSRPKHLGDG